MPYVERVTRAGQALELQQKPCKTRAGNKNNFRSCMVQIRANGDKGLLRG